MVQQTSYYDLPYPEASDPPAGHTQIQALAEAVENLPPKIDNMGDATKNFRLRSPRLDMNGHVVAVGVGASPRWASYGHAAGEDLLFTRDGKVCIRLGISGLSNTDPGTSNQGICVESAGSTTNLNIKAMTSNSSGDDVAVRVAGNDNRLVKIISSAKYKTHIQPLSDDLIDAVLQLKPVTYLPKDPQPDDDPYAQIGLIAEDVAPVLPNVVGFNDENEPETVRYSRLVTPLIGLVQKQQDRIDQLEQRLAALEAA